MSQQVSSEKLFVVVKSQSVLAVAVESPALACHAPASIVDVVTSADVIGVEVEPVDKINVTVLDEEIL